MDIAFRTGIAAVGLLTILAGNGNSQAKSPNPGKPKQSTSQSSHQRSSPDSQPLVVPSPQTEQETQGRSVTVSEPARSPELKELFSQLTLFVFASGVGLLIALLAWSDQIRGIDKDISELKQRFLEETGIDKRTFLRIVKPESPDDRGLALLQVVSAGRIKTKNTAEVLRIFTKWNKQWLWIERLCTGKYFVTIILTIVLFLVGIASLFTNPSQQIQVFSFPCKVEILILTGPATLVALLLTIIICIAERENALRSLLKSVSEKV